MEYALLIYQDAEFDARWERASEAERAGVYAAHTAFAELLERRGAARGGNELAVAAHATTVRKPHETATEAVVTDGPFAELAEQLGGYYLVEARDLDEALELARALPARTVEVRPIVRVEEHADA